MYFSMPCDKHEKIYDWCMDNFGINEDPENKRWFLFVMKSMGICDVYIRDEEDGMAFKLRWMESEL